MSGWFLAAFSGLHLLLTVLIIVWRVSALIQKQQQKHDAAMAAHQISDQLEFNKLGKAIDSIAHEIRTEFGTTITMLRSNMAAIQAELADRINRLEIQMTKDYIRKDAFYDVIREMNAQIRDDFLEIKDWLKRLENKLP